MINKKLALGGVLAAATLFSASTFSSHHSHHFPPRIKFFHHHHSHAGRNIHRWEPHRNYIVVRNRSPYSQLHHHY